MYKWYLPTLSEIIALSEPTRRSRQVSQAELRVQAEREWSGAIAALNQLLSQSLDDEDPVNAPSTPVLRGVVLSGSVPVLDQPGLVSSFLTWTFTSTPLKATAWMPFQMLPSADADSALSQMARSTLSLLPSDPLASEQFCLVLTPDFSLAMALGEDSEQQPTFLFSFDPEVVWQGWRSLRSRLQLTSPYVLSKLDSLIDRFAPVAPDYRTVTQFSRLMLAGLASALDDNPTPGRSNDFSNPLDGILSESNSVGDRRHNERKSWNALRRSKDARPIETINTAPDPDHAAHRSENTKATGDRADIELLQAIAHEVRTPLSTIRTLTRLLLKRKDLGPDVVKRLEIIDRECTEQIDRFSLIFRAVELETASGKQPLTPPSAISLTQLFQQNVPRWQQQASQRNLTLEVTVPAKLPLVLADSTMLDQMLTGLIDRITHSLPPGSHIQVRVKLAGHQLKLQFQSQPWGDDSELGNGQGQVSSTLKSIGEMLILQPETGSLSLNLSVTKNLFQALGGKLIVRQRPKRGEELTIFLPLETQKSEESP